jgi:transcriptional regulator of acetoin/glycerol metabolism
MGGFMYLKEKNVYFSEQGFFTEELDQMGVQIFGELEIHPVVGKRRFCKLNRTEIDFISHDLQEHFKGQSTMLIDAMAKQSLHFRLTRVKAVNSTGSFRDRYILKSMNGIPFTHNGTKVFESLVEQKDTCYLGENKIFFCEKNNGEGDQAFELDDKVLGQKNILCSDLPILIQGETGTGKTVLAKKIHERSEKRGLFVHLNLSSFSPSLIESELFGHVRGAFTGALNNKKGAFELANEGTLFLDEIDSLPIDIQTKLLLFLDNQSFRVVGDEKEKSARTRLIFSTSTPLDSLVEKGMMRRDFFYRLNTGVLLRMPALRDDINRLERFLNLYCIQHNIALTYKLREFYKSLPWPGNIRELNAHLNKKVVLSKGRKLDFDDNDDVLIKSSSEIMHLHQDELMSLEHCKKVYARRAYFNCQQNLSQTATKLKISVKTLKALLDNAA